MDALGGYTGGNYVQHLSPGEIKRMKKNMKKVPIIHLKSEVYHNKEAQEAEEILQDLPHESSTSTHHPLHHSQHHIFGYTSRISKLRQRFISLF